MTTSVSVHYKLLGFLRALFRNCTRIKRNAGDILIAHVFAAHARGARQGFALWCFII